MNMLLYAMQCRIVNFSNMYGTTSWDKRTILVYISFVLKNQLNTVISQYLVLSWLIIQLTVILWKERRKQSSPTKGSMWILWHALHSGRRVPYFLYNLEIWLYSYITNQIVIIWKNTFQTSLKKIHPMCIPRVFFAPYIKITCGSHVCHSLAKVRPCLQCVPTTKVRQLPRKLVPAKNINFL